MKINLTLVIAFCGLCSLPNCPLFSQMEIRKGESIICQFDHRDRQDASHSSSFDPISKPSSSISKRYQSFTSQFEVKFIGFPPSAEAAVQKAIDIWASTLKSDVKIRLFVNWTVNTNSPNNLAFVVPTEARNFKGALLKDTWYPITLAEKLAQIDLNSTAEADIVATFNAGRTDWYFGTDGRCPVDKFDLVTIALHELGHGLGFSGTFFISNGSGSFGANGTSDAKVYDIYLQNGSGKRLVDPINFTNPSLELGTQLVGNSLIFKSDIASQLNIGGSFPRIYAPNPYNPGSSISHLDEGTYNNTRNSLMTPFSNFGEVMQSTGPLAKGIFYEMGWLNTYLSHTDFSDKESLVGVSFDLDAKSDTLLNTSSGKLYYSYDDFASSNNIPLQSLSGTSWVAEIPSPQIEKKISYYFTINDIFERVYRYPIDPTKTVSFFYGVDTKKPNIVHQPVSEILEFQKQIPIGAEVTDNVGIQTVEVEYQINSGVLKKIPLLKKIGNSFGTVLDLTSEIIKGGDKIKYRVIATDNSSQANINSAPLVDYYTVTVKLFETKDVFISDLNSDKSEFFGDFAILKPVGFVNSAIHTLHPYPNSSLPSSNVDFSQTLLYPIRLRDKDSFLEFDEVVLIEPINDYVIVEGTSDRGLTWKPLKPAYDSRANLDWLTYFNSNIQNGDSKALGTLNYFRSSKINLLSTFKNLDEILIRFRLNSNNLKNGWGWAIDNIKIQDQVVGLEDNFDSSYNGIQVFPNPFNDKLLVRFQMGSLIGDLKILSILGSQVASSSSDINSIEFNTSQWPTGIYILCTKNKDGITFRKKIIKK
jgi:hypothetical protein